MSFPSNNDAPWVFVSGSETLLGVPGTCELEWLEIGVPESTDTLTWAFSKDMIGEEGKVIKVATFLSVKVYVEGFLVEKAKKKENARKFVTEQLLKEVSENGALFVKRSLPLSFERSSLQKESDLINEDKLLLPAFVVDQVLCRYCSVRREPNGGDKKTNERDQSNDQDDVNGGSTESFLFFVTIMFFAFLFAASLSAIIYILLLTTSGDSLRDSTTFSSQYVNVVNDALKYFLNGGDEVEEVGQCKTSY